MFRVVLGGMKSYPVIFGELFSYSYEIRIPELNNEYFMGGICGRFFLFSCFNLLNLLRNFYWKLKMQISVATFL